MADQAPAPAAGGVVVDERPPFHLSVGQVRHSLEWRARDRERGLGEERPTARTLCISRART
jgi:hypothetical protein